MTKMEEEVYLQRNIGTTWLLIGKVGKTRRGISLQFPGEE